MASKALTLAGGLAGKRYGMFAAQANLSKSHSLTSVRTAVTTAKGEILANPATVRFGSAKIFCVAIPGMLVGATLAKNGAAWLEENEIFIPDDDDDD